MIRFLYQVFYFLYKCFLSKNEIWFYFWIIWTYFFILLLLLMQFKREYLLNILHETQFIYAILRNLNAPLLHLSRKWWKRHHWWCVSKIKLFTEYCHLNKESNLQRTVKRSKLIKHSIVLLIIFLWGLFW